MAARKPSAGVPIQSSKTTELDINDVGVKTVNSTESSHVKTSAVTNESMDSIWTCIDSTTEIMNVPSGCVICRTSASGINMCFIPSIKFMDGVFKKTN